MTIPDPIRVLLVDDEDATHFLHRRLIRRTLPTAATSVAFDGAEALDILQKAASRECPPPTHIWLDLNMPNIDGWRFLEGYQSIKWPSESLPKITIVTSSPNHRDRQKALENPVVSDYVEKFMDIKTCEEILCS